MLHEKKNNFFFSCSCIFYTKCIIFATESDVSIKIIWFYLVRAEVVLWWHCLIFFALIHDSFPTFPAKF